MDWPEWHHKAAKLAERRLLLIVRRKLVPQRSQLGKRVQVKVQVSATMVEVTVAEEVIIAMETATMSPCLSVKGPIRLVNVLLGQLVGTQVVRQEIAPFHTDTVDFGIGDMN